MGEPLLDVRGITRTYGAVKAVSDLSFSLERGQVFGFIGPNGAGKTTTMRILATIDLPDEGDAVVDGRSVLVQPREVRKRVGFMADQFVPYANLTVMQFLDFSARSHGLRGRERIRTVGSVVSFCGLAPLANRPANGLSKGMGQRLHLAKTLLHDPSLLVLDEPTAGLDPRARIEFRDLVGAMKEAGKGILISSHILSELAESCDGIVVIEKGKKIVSGGLEEIRRGLAPHRTITVRCLGGTQPALEFALVQPLVRGATADADRVRFELEGDDVALADLVSRAVAAGVRICEVRVEHADLEDIFLRTTQGNLQ